MGRNPSYTSNVTVRQPLCPKTNSGYGHYLIGHHALYVTSSICIGYIGIRPLLTLTGRNLRKDYAINRTFSIV